MSPPVGDADALYVTLFPQNDGDAVARFIERNQAREAEIIAEWRRLCASSFGVHQGLSEQVFDQVYVPGLRHTYVCLWRRDAAAVVSFGRSLGEELAWLGVPFVAFVAYLHFLKQSYAKVFAGEPDLMSENLPHIDAIHSYLVSIVADAYHAWRPERGRSEAARGDGEAPLHVFHGMAGRSAAMRRVFDRIERLADAASPVLILGETGTGKELVARAIHAAGRRRLAPFIAVNCAALPRDLIESELFGYRRGAFSGAVTECLGLFRAASGGTLLLDEITEMAPELQAKLLRVLQDKAVRPVGSVTEVPVDVRVIASSNRDPEEALASGVLRADLYYRLSSSSVVLPPLRVRREDIPVLVQHWIAQTHDPAAAPSIGQEAMAALAAREWPGNVRELFNVLDEAVSLAEGPEVHGWAVRAAADRGRGASWAPPDERTRLPTLEAAERELIARALRSADGNKVHAARQLGISRTQLYAKIAKYNL